MASQDDGNTLDGLIVEYECRRMAMLHAAEISSSGPCWLSLCDIPGSPPPRVQPASAVMRAATVGHSPSHP
ncbi:hypothetical protein V2G26_012560 [Clonostachys chloroleuca]